jgi:hypothetical protein
VTSHDFSNVTNQQTTPKTTQTTHPSIPLALQTKPINIKLLRKHHVSSSNYHRGHQKGRNYQLPFQNRFYLISQLLLFSLSFIFYFLEERSTNRGSDTYNDTKGGDHHGVIDSHTILPESQRDFFFDILTSIAIRRHDDHSSTGRLSKRTK